MITEENISTENEIFESDNWDDMDFSDILGEPSAGDAEEEESPAEPEQENQLPEESEETDVAAEAAVEEKEEDQLFPLPIVFLGEEKKVRLDEARDWIQKGMNHDKIQSELKTYKDFLNELAGPQKISIEQLMDNTRAAMLINSEKAAGRTMDMETALERVKFAKERKAFEEGREVEQKTKTAEQEAEAARKKGFADFARDYPDVDVKAIPKEVWDKVAAGEALTAAYARFENKRLREEISAMKKKAENAARTTGSMKDAGKGKASSDFDALWNDGT
jgi:hypothetical protein